MRDKKVEVRDCRRAKWILCAAAIYSLSLLLPLFGTEAMLARHGQPLFDRPEYFYGFLGKAATTQLVYWTIGEIQCVSGPLCQS
jgi:hypothetical protein